MLVVSVLLYFCWILLQSASILTDAAWCTEASAETVIDIIFGRKAILLEDFLANPVWMDYHADMAWVAFFFTKLGVVHSILAGKAENTINANGRVLHASESSTGV